MKKKTITNKTLTREDLREILDDKLHNYPTKDDFKQFRSDMFSRFDQIVGELAQGREDRLFIDHDIRGLKETDDDHGKRIKKLEKRINN
jgi:hypothetical protein